MSIDAWNQYASSNCYTFRSALAKSLKVSEDRFNECTVVAGSVIVTSVYNNPTTGTTTSTLAADFAATPLDLSSDPNLAGVAVGAPSFAVANAAPVETSSEKLSGGSIAAIVLGVILFIVLVILVVLVCKSSSSPAPKQDGGVELTNLNKSSGLPDGWRETMYPMGPNNEMVPVYFNERENISQWTKPSNNARINV